MHIRCGSCHGAVWFQITARTRMEPIVSCRTCSQEYDLGTTLDRIDVADLHQNALELAKSSEIDLQSAYSVLLGIFSIEEARDSCEPNPRPPKTAVDIAVEATLDAAVDAALNDTADDTADTASADTASAVSFDPAFAEAIEAGHLTPDQAMQRGSRQAFAQSLVARHRLPLKRALAVADNRVPLLAAIREKKPRATINVDPERKRRSAVPFVIAGAAAMLVIGIFVALTWNPDEAGKAKVRPGSAKTQFATVEVTVNLDGELIEVSGQNPESVLAAYCESASSGERVPVGVEATDDDWTGLYREDGAYYAVKIRRDSEHGLWVAGDAVEPIEVERSVKNHGPQGPAAQRTSAAQERIVVARNARGAALRVSASDPATVLLAYCQVHAGGAGCEPLELRSGIPAEAGLRLGIFRDFSEQLLRITIRRGQADRRWIAGDGTGLIQVAPAGESLPGTFVIPIRL